MRFYIALLCLPLVLCACGGNGESGAKGDDTEIVGGYSKPRKLTKDEKALFEEAVQGLEGVEYKPLNVATQVVAGTNYRFICRGRETARKGKRFDAVIVVYKPLPGQGEPRVTSVDRQKQ